MANTQKNMAVEATKTFVDINKIKDFTKANIIVIADENGMTLDSYQTEYPSNLSLMSQASFEMCRDLLKDMTSSSLKQLIAKSEENYYIINETKNNNLVLIGSSDISKLGLLMKFMNTL